jgi:hypothetical protein
MRNCLRKRREVLGEARYLPPRSSRGKRDKKKSMENFNRKGTRRQCSRVIQNQVRSSVCGDACQGSRAIFGTRKSGYFPGIFEGSEVSLSDNDSECSRLRPGSTMPSMRGSCREGSRGASGFGVKSSVMRSPSSPERYCVEKPKFVWGTSRPLNERFPVVAGADGK